MDRRWLFATARLLSACSLLREPPQTTSATSRHAEKSALHSGNLDAVTSTQKATGCPRLSTVLIACRCP